MKRITVSIALIFLVISMTFSTNLQKIYTTRDDVYKRVSALCMRSDVIGPSSSSPLSAKALLIALDRINPDKLEEHDKAEYDELYSILTEENYILKTEGFSLDMDLGVNLGVNIAGSGPSVFALSDSRSLADRGKEIMERHFALEKIENEIYVTKVGKTGARVVE